VVAAVPVSYRLFLEKQLADVSGFVRKLPVLDASETWNLDPSTDAWKTEPVRTIRTKKVPRNHVKAEATENHPAQVEVRGHRPADRRRRTRVPTGTVTSTGRKVRDLNSLRPHGGGCAKEREAETEPCRDE
jgi:hypothetical protein